MSNYEEIFNQTIAGADRHITPDHIKGKAKYFKSTYVEQGMVDSTYNSNFTSLFGKSQFNSNPAFKSFTLYI